MNHAMLTSLTLAILSLTTALNVSAQQPPFTGYNCSVKNVFELSKGGLVAANLSSTYKDANFYVERKTGKMSGSHGLSSSGWIGRNEVLDLGSDQQSYKSIYVSPPLVHIRVLQVQEYMEGLTKSFIFTEDTTVFTGDCLHAH